MEIFDKLVLSFVHRGRLASRAIRADARREKFRNSMETFAFLSFSAH